MYTIIMTNDKQLVATVKTAIYQREKLADKIQFLLPLEYGGMDLSECSVKFTYVDQSNTAQTILLKKCKKEYKHKLKYTFPVDTNITKFAGDITGHITCTYIDTDMQEVHVLHTSETTITVLPLSDYYAFVDDESLEVIDQKILELEARIDATNILAESIEDGKADNLIVEENRLSLTANGNKIGDEVDIVTPKINDGEYDGTYDGILELPDSGDDDGDGDGDGDGGSTEPLSNINLKVEDNQLFLTSNGNKIGDAVDVGIPKINDGTIDGDYDGILELPDEDD